MDPKTLREVPSGELHERAAGLQRQIEGLTLSAGQAEAQARAARSEISRLTQHLNTIKNEVDRRNTPAPTPRISEHALLRYIERAHNVDLDLLRERILSPSVVAAIRAGASGVIVDNVKFVVQGATIVTTLNDEQRIKGRDAKRGKVVKADTLKDGLQDYLDEREAVSA